MRFLILTCLLTLIAPPLALAQDEMQNSSDAPILNIQEVTSPGGITAWLAEDHSVPVIAVSFAFKGAGAAQDPEGKQGLSRLTSNTMDEGAGELESQDFQKKLRDQSISLYFNSSRDQFGGKVKTLSRYKDTAFEMLHLALTEPRFDAEPLARMREANMARIRNSLSDPNWIAARLLNDRAYEGHPYALNSGGTLTTLNTITAQDLHDFVQTRLGRDNLHIAVAGDITADDLSAALDDIFADLPETSETPPVADLTLQNQGQVYSYNKDIPQTIIEIMQPGIARDDEDYHTAQIMNYILGSSGFGSRLTEEIREKRGLTYGIYSDLVVMDHFAGLGVSTSTQTDNAAEMLSLIRQEWQNMADNGITDDELQSAQTYLIGALPLSLSSTDNIAGIMLSLMLDDLPSDYLDQRENNIRAATASDVNQLAARLLDAQAFVTVVVGQPGAIENATAIETLPNAE